jgi:tetratricopeptide (TPR) repeat protein
VENGIAEFQEGLRLDPNGVVLYANLTVLYLSLNRLDEAKATIGQALQRNLNGPELHDAVYQVAFVRKDGEAMRQEMAEAERKPELEEFFHLQQSRTDAYFGRLQEAREFSRRAVELALRGDNKESAALFLAGTALWESDFRNATHAIKVASSALSLAPGRDVWLRTALAFARAGDTVKAKELEVRLDKEFPLDTLIQIGGCLPSEPKST